ncbi:MAG: MerR family transcriptional regulator [Pseudomonadota bacterium]|nr:MerR family transcriptional regulator [Pseudomonadota bacterium]
MKIGELSEKSGRTDRTLRFYEELGLLVPASRTKGGFRLYDGSALVRIHWISRLQELGFSLPEIKDFLTEIQGNPNAPGMMGDLRAAYAAKLADTRATLARLQALEAELAASLDYLDTCKTCAPATHKTACRACREDDHAEKEAPAMVAAVHSPSPTG